MTAASYLLRLGDPNYDYGASSSDQRLEILVAAVADAERGLITLVELAAIAKAAA